MNLIPLCLLSLFWVALALLAAAPGIIGGDGPELTAAAFHLGSAHAPGYPLFITLGHLFQLLPLGTPTFRMTFLSILAQAGAFIVLVKTLDDIQTGFVHSPFEKGGMKGGISLWFPPIVTAGFVFAGPLVFRQLVSPEVFALHLFFVAVLLRLILFPSLANFLAASFFLGLSLSHQHLTLLILPALLWACRAHLRSPKSLATAFSLFAFGLSPYLILPLRAVQHPLVNWGNPANFQQFLYHLSRTQYGGDITRGALMNGVMEIYLYAKDLFLESYGLGLTFLLLGFLVARKSLKAEYYVGGFCLFVLLPFLIRGSNDPENNHVNEAFLPPALLWFAPLMFKGWEWIFDRLRTVKKVLIFTFSLLLTLLTFHTFSQVNTSRNLAVEDVTRSMLLQMPSKSVLYSEGDAITFPLAYLNLVLKLRQDVTLLDRTGGLFEDLYHILDYRKSPNIPPEQLVATERAHEDTKHPSAVFYTENTDVPGRPLTMTGLLFQVLNGTDSRPKDELFWWLAPEPRISLDHDYFSRETAARYYLFKAPYELDVRKDPVQGMVDLTHGKELGHDNSRLLVNAGLVENSHDWTDQAALTFEKATQLDPRFHVAWYDRGVVAEKQNHLQEAAGYFQKTIQLAPGYADAHQHLGFVFYQGRRYEEAVQEWQTVIKIDPLYAGAYRNLGYMFMDSRPDYAAQMIQHYLVLTPNAPDRSSLEQWLSSQNHLN